MRSGAEQSSTSDGSTRRYFRHGTLVFGLLVFGALGMFALSALWESGGAARAQDPYLDRAYMWIGLGPAFWFGFQVVRPHVSTDDLGIAIVNPFTRTVAPWSAVAAIGIEPLTITLVDGRTVKPFAFSSSQLAELIGDRSQRKAEREITAQFRAASAGYDPMSKYQHRVNFGLLQFAIATLGWLLLSYIAYKANQ